MKKYIRKQVKDEKRIVLLMYRKGLFKELNIELNSLGWEYEAKGKRKRRRKGNRKYTFREDVPVLHTFWCDYWGEGDSRSVVDLLQQHLFWRNIEGTDEDGWPIGKKYYKVPELIEYLKKLPSVVGDSKINKYLKLFFE